jgi:2-keto-4-pentenoate hydratase
MTGARESDLMEAANLLMNARRTGVPMDELPAAVRPQTVEEAYFVQDTIAVAYETIGGWKVGAPNLETTPMFAPMPLIWMAPSGASISGVRSRYRGLEAEIAFVFGQDLPAQTRPYTRDEVLGAVASAHPVIEVLESGLVDPAKADKLSMIADLQMHGGLIYGPAVADWQSIDWSTEEVVLAIDGAVRVERTGSNTSGDLLGLLVWLANDGAARTGGLKRGQWVTTGSWTGNEQGEPNTAIDVQFSHAGRVGLRFENAFSAT